MNITPSGASCGARVTGIDLAGDLSPNTIAAIRKAWLEHKVLAFAEQSSFDDAALERFTLAMGGFGSDPFFDPIPGHDNIAAIQREADETSTIFAENWHSDWSFQEKPPAGTCLRAVEIPPVGGDTLFCDQVAAFAALPDERKDYLRTLTAIHSAARGYAPDGLYGDNDSSDRSMTITPGKAALARQSHPLIQRHPETGKEAIYCSVSYVVGIEGLSDMEALQIVMELHQWCEQDQFVCRHQWEPDMLVMWDNRSVNHKATGGYEGHRRELHRTTIAAYA
ncbi:MAG: TauD/TfdA family dioxygenase [Pseudomonadota bacterium]